MWLKSLFFLLAAAAALLVGVLLGLTPVVAVAVVLFAVAGLAAWRGVYPYHSQR